MTTTEKDPFDPAVSYAYINMSKAYGVSYADVLTLQAACENIQRGWVVRLIDDAALAIFKRLQVALGRDRAMALVADVNDATTATLKLFNRSCDCEACKRRTHGGSAEVVQVTEIEIDSLPREIVEALVKLGALPGWALADWRKKGVH